MSSFAMHTDPLDGLLRKAGAVFAARGSHPVAISFGSPAGELAVCVSAVGLTDRSELTKLVLEAPADQLPALVTRLAGSSVAVGGALRTRGAWWCGAGPGRVVVLGEAHTGVWMREHLLAQSRFHHSLTVRDVSEEWAAIGLIGRCAWRVLRTLGVYGRDGDPRRTPPFSTTRLDGIELDWLLESDHSALAILPREQAGAVWRAIEAAGRPFGISCVGHEAASRYALLERTRSETPLH